MPVPPAVLEAFDPERFRAAGHRRIDALADQLARWHAREGLAVPWRDPAEARRAWAELLPEGGAAPDLVDDLLRVARASTALAHPHVMAHQVPPPLPAAVLAETASALLNNGMTVAEMGPDFELALAPESNIVCYRHLPEAGAGLGPDLDAHNRALRARVLADGRFYIAGTQLPRGYCLRSTLMNPLIEPGDLSGLLDHLRQLCRP